MPGKLLPLSLPLSLSMEEGAAPGEEKAWQACYLDHSPLNTVLFSERNKDSLLKGVMDTLEMPGLGVEVPMAGLAPTIPPGMSRSPATNNF